VLSRLFDMELDVTKTAGKKRVWELAAALVPAQQPGRFNEGLMELGALVCTPIGPTCEACPLARFCLACKRGIQAERPVQTPKRPPKPVQIRTAWIRRPEAGLLLLKSPPSGLFGGLWNLPMFPQDASPSRRPLSLRAFRTALQESLGIELVRCEPAARLTHQLTHRLLQISVSSCALGSGPLELNGFSAARWVKTPAGLAKIGVSSLTRKILAACADPLLEAQ
jgi:A/G-specific adenine glycosylase